MDAGSLNKHNFSRRNLKGRRPEKIFFFDQALHIEWQDGKKTKIPCWDLRYDCPCAACVDELTGQKTVQPADILKNIDALGSEYIGNYALRIHWSDSHSTGIYTFRRLRENYPVSS